MRLALLVAATALLASSAAFAFNPQPDPPGRHGGHVVVAAARKTGGQHGRMGGDPHRRCHDHRGRPERCR